MRTYPSLTQQYPMHFLVSQYCANRLIATSIVHGERHTCSKDQSCSFSTIKAPFMVQKLSCVSTVLGFARKWTLLLWAGLDCKCLQAPIIHNRLDSPIESSLFKLQLMVKDSTHTASATPLPFTIWIRKTALLQGSFPLLSWWPMTSVFWFCIKGFQGFHKPIQKHFVRCPEGEMSKIQLHALIYSWGKVTKEKVTAGLDPYH